MRIPPRGLARVAMAGLILGLAAPVSGGEAAPGDWPMIRGGQGLLGRAPGQLPDRLKLLWRFKTDDEVLSSAALVGGRVYIGSNDEHIYALDAATGRKLWAFAAEDVVESAPLFLDGALFVGSSDGLLYCLDAKTGKLRWKYATDDKIVGGANWTRSPDGKATWILVGSHDSKVHCVDAATGEGVWTYATSSFVNGAPAVAEGRAVFGGCDHGIHVVSVADGSKIARIEGGGYIAASAALAGRHAYVGTYNNELLCVDIVAREVAWRYKPGGAPFFASAAVGEDRLVVGSRDQRVHCVRRDTGERLWTFRTGGDVDSSPVICGDKVVVGSGDGRLYLLRLADGAKLWAYTIGQPVTASPAVGEGRVVVGSEDGYVYAFGPAR